MRGVLHSKNKWIRIYFLPLTTRHNVMNSADALVEGNVSSHVLSFTKESYLYTGTVCKTWRDNHAIDARATNVLRVLESVSMVKEEVEEGVHTLDLFDLAVVFCRDGRVLKQLWDMGVRWCHNTTRYYAAFTGNVTAMRLGSAYEYCDECDIYEAVRGGHIDAVECAVGNMVPDADRTTIGCIPEWHTNVYDAAFVRRCICIAQASNRHDVVGSLHAYTKDEYYRNSVLSGKMTCVDLAVAKSRADICEVLRGACK